MHHPTKFCFRSILLLTTLFLVDTHLALAGFSYLQDSSFVKFDRDSVTYAEKITATFQNIGEKQIAVMTTGCGLPDGGYLPNFVIEEKRGGEWDTAGAPICIAIATPPIILAPGEYQTINFPVHYGLDPPEAEGWYRYVFDIRFVDKGGTYRGKSQIPKASRTSEVLKISHQ